MTASLVLNEACAKAMVLRHSSRACFPRACEGVSAATCGFPLAAGPIVAGSSVMEGRPGRGPMTSDVTLAVGDGARRMTYAELAAVRRISPASAKRLTQRHRWGRQMGNDGVVRVTVPLSASSTPENRARQRFVVAGDRGDRSPSLSPPMLPASSPMMSSTTSSRRQMYSRGPSRREQHAKADQREESERRRAEHAERQLRGRASVGRGRSQADRRTANCARRCRDRRVYRRR